MKKVKKNIVITGGAQGIGKATCILLSEKGYHIIAFDNDNEALAELKDEYPDIEIYAGDVSNENDIILFLKKFNNSKLCGLVNNAAIGINKFPVDLSIEEWNRILAVNLTGPFLMAKHFFPFLKTCKGSIINIASTRAFMSEPNTEAYSASKGGLVALTHALAISFAPYVRVNCISPGWIEVGDLKKKSARLPVHHSEADKLQHPAGRVGVPEDIAYMIEYLFSDKSGFITGQNFINDGGMSKKMIYV
jgi:NAD(P)-dependent dehydrogenase (short-subunit alcohol dehydrogenase family)